MSASVAPLPGENVADAGLLTFCHLFSVAASTCGIIPTAEIDGILQLQVYGHCQHLDGKSAALKPQWDEKPVIQKCLRARCQAFPDVVRRPQVILSICCPLAGGHQNQVPDALRKACGRHGEFPGYLPTKPPIFVVFRSNERSGRRSVPFWLSDFEFKKLKNGFPGIPCLIP